MSAYLEFQLKGGGVAVVEVGMIGAAVAKGVDAWKLGSKDSPTLVVLRAGETLEVVDQSVGGVIGRCVAARQTLKQLRYEQGPDAAFVDWLQPLAEDEK